MKVLITGAKGFVARNLIVRLRELGSTEILTFVRSDSMHALRDKVAEADFIFHLAGVNRPKDPAEFTEGNAELTRALCEAVASRREPVRIAFASSTQAGQDNPYGISKRKAEEALQALSAADGTRTYVYRLPNVFGKWARPNYNSVVATFCHHISRGLPIQIHDPQAEVDLVYIDDLVSSLIELLGDTSRESGLQNVQPRYRITVGALARQLFEFRDGRTSMTIDAVGCGLTRALYSTYISYFAPEQFTYALDKHEDARGVFVEFLKTRDSGQFSYFTARPGVTRGGHYHHSKTEKFLVLKGEARFRFRNIDTGEMHQCDTRADAPVVVETIPGWTHDITNIGSEDLVVMLWANEVFDRSRPDTIADKVA